jgi:Replication initiator protein A (RepA) N-terminus.
MGQSITFDYYYGTQADQYSFYRIPKMLFTNEHFKTLSCEAKVLYGLLLDRMSLSIKNRWFDENNKVYIIFTIDEVGELLSCAKQKAVKIMSELDSGKGIGLIEKKRTGLGRANIIYVKNFMLQEEPVMEEKEPKNLENTQKYENHTSRGVEIKPQEVLESNFKEYENQTLRNVKIKPQEVLKSNCSYTDITDTDISDTESNHIQSRTNVKKIDAIGAYKEIICDNIEYDVLCQRYEKESVDEIVELMLEVVASKRQNFRIAGEEIPASMVKGRFMKITYIHIEYVFTSLQQTTTKIGNIKKYLLAVIYNAPATINHYYQTTVQHDLYGG